jgi:hypothetical protein
MGRRDGGTKGRLGSKVEVEFKFEGLGCILYNILAWPDHECGLSLHNIQPFVVKSGDISGLVLKWVHKVQYRGVQRPNYSQMVAQSTT